MYSNYPVISILLGSLGLLNGIFVGIYLALSRNGDRPDIFLSALICTLSVKISYAIMYSVPSIDDGVVFFYKKLAISAYLLAGPFLLFYIRSVWEKDFRFRRAYLLYFLPSLMIFFFNQPVIDHLVRLIVVQIYLVAFLAGSYYLLLQYRKKQPHRTNIHKRVFEWHRILIIGTGILWLSVFTRSLVELSVLYALSMYLLILLLIRKKKLFRLRPASNGRDHTETEEKLLRFMEEQQPYLDPEITLQKLADQLQVKVHVLSAVINNQLNCNFKEFINLYRIRRSKEMLTAGELQNKTIAGIGYDCGFKNTSTFNLAFKKFYNCTPREYIRLQGPVAAR
ncbi:MAG: helix-turn-helix transcriptional regulator [Bacteroidales bacterium]|jgi:AraC-like DNA-binding protein